MIEANDPMVAYVVRPKRAYLTLLGWIRNSARGCVAIGCLGCSSSLVGIVLLVVLAMYWRALDQGLTWGMRFYLFVTSASVAFACLSFIDYVGCVVAENRAIANTKTNVARENLRNIRRQVQAMAHHAHLARRSYAHAVVEHDAHRYAAFWDEIEEAARQVDAFRAAQFALAGGIENYVNVLYGTEHSFPFWYEGITEIPELGSTMHDMNRLRRAAESDFHFANIWEHRQSRQVLIAGFQTLGEGLRHLEESVITSLDALKKAVSRSVTIQGVPAAGAINILARFVIPIGNAADQSR